MFKNFKQFFSCCPYLRTALLVDCVYRLKIRRGLTCLAAQSLKNYAAQQGGESNEAERIFAGKTL